MDRPYIIRPQRRNGRPRLDVYPVQITETQRSGTLNGFITQWLIPA
jgi:hypothetical protein